MTSEIGDVDWTSILEDYFSSSGEKAHCLAWCHKQAESLYSNRRNWIDIPCIMLSSVIGFLNAGSSSMFNDPKISSIALGVGSLVVGVLQTVNTYFGWAKKAEGHRISSIQYAKLYRFLKIEMALPRSQRINPNDLLKRIKDDYDRLQEISPLLPNQVIEDFKKKFSDAKYAEISKPEETNGLEKITVFEERVTKSKSIDVLNSPIMIGNPLREG